MVITALVAQIGEVLGRGHALFGNPVVLGDPAAAAASRKLAGAVELAHSGQQRAAALTGELATGYAAFAGAGHLALDGMAGTDDRLSGELQTAEDADRSGRVSSEAVLDGAAADTAALGPFSTTPAGQKALLSALRARIVQQQRIIAAYRARDAQLCARLQSMTYPGSAAPAAGGGGGGVPAMPQLPPLGGLGGLANLFATHGGGAPPSSVPARVTDIAPGPAGVAVRAALTKLGAPYVWGAEGPSEFDCSGYTEWAWRQAGVQLGDDTYAQVEQGVAVPPGQVRAGDLIFPADSYTSAGPGHVMLAISPTEVAHAPQSGDVVRVAAMPAAYVARRPLPPA